MPDSVEKLTSKVQESRIQLSGYDAYKQKKQEDRNLFIKADKETKTEVIQSEIAYDEPPAEELKVAEGHPVDKELLHRYWLEFSQSAGLRAASLMKALLPDLQGKEVIVTTASAAQQNALEEIRIDFIRFVSEKTNGQINSMRIEKGAVEMTERKPYTEKEKLEYMLNKNPQWKDVIDKLGLRLP